MSSLRLTVAIPTYQREQVLVETLQALLPLLSDADELLIVDQTERHAAETEHALEKFERLGQFTWIRCVEASITGAMNMALLRAKGDIIVFLDDDIAPDACLLEAHREAHSRLAETPVLVAGRVVQPWQEGVDYSSDTEFHFATLRSREIAEFMGGNFSVRRGDALTIGGFDTNFVRVAYRFEAEFAWRWRKAGRVIRYEPAAMIHHLKAASGGTRSFGDHLTTMRPDHAVGEYYYAMRTQTGLTRMGAIVRRMWRSIITRHHLRRPWWIPLTLMAELRGVLWALTLYHHGPALVSPPADADRKQPRPC